MEDRNLVTEEQQMQEQPVAQDKYCGYPMKWYKWLIYFSLFCTAFMCIVGSWEWFTGTVYYADGVLPEQIYAVFPGMKWVDRMNGIWSVAQGVIALIVRWKLARLRVDGPKWLYILYGMDLVQPLVYGVCASNATTLPFTQAVNVPSLVGGLIGAGVAFLLNHIYFTKRKALFVN